MDGRQEAHLVAIACSDAPEGHTHWTLQLLAGKVVAMGFAESISFETVRQVLKKTELKPWTKKEWCIPKVSPEFVARMEDVLDLYHQDYDARPSRGLFRRDVASHWWPIREAVHRGQAGQGGTDMTMNSSETGPETSSCSVSRKLAGGMSR